MHPFQEKNYDLKIIEISQWPSGDEKELNYAGNLYIVCSALFICYLLSIKSFSIDIYLIIS